jgi:hypothetical protein
VEARARPVVKVRRRRVAALVPPLLRLHKDAAGERRERSQLKTPSHRAAILRSRRL